MDQTEIHKIIGGNYEQLNINGLNICKKQTNAQTQTSRCNHEGRENMNRTMCNERNSCCQRNAQGLMISPLDSPKQPKRNTIFTEILLLKKKMKRNLPNSVVKPVPPESKTRQGPKCKVEL